MYQFRLGRVLEYRRRREEQSEREFRAVRRMLQDEETLLESLQKDYRESLSGLYSTQDVGVLGAELKIFYRHQQILSQKVETQKTVVARQAAVVTEKYQDLLKARQEKKIIEELQEKEKKRYLKELSTREQQFFDELASKRFYHGE